LLQNTDDAAMLGLSCRGLVVVAAATVSGLLFGYDLCVVTDALEPLASDLSLSTPQQESVVSVVMAAAAVGALLGGLLGDAIGRRTVIWICAALFTTGALASGLSPGLSALLASRAAVGVAVGASGMVVSVYVAELVPPASRGALVAMNEVAICVGCLLALALGAVLTPSAVESSWRWLLGAGAVPGLVLLLAGACLPHSPLWLARRGKVEGAVAAARLLWADGPAAEASVRAAVARWAERPRGSEASEGRAEGGYKARSADASAEAVTVTPAGRASGRASVPGRGAVLEREQLLPEGGADGSPGAGVTDLARLVWSDPVSRRMLGVAVFVGVGQNLCFSNSVLYFARPLLRAAGVSDEAASVAVIGVGFAKLAGVLGSLWLLDRCGRRPMLLGGTAAQALLAAAMAAVYATEAGPVRQWGVTACIFLFVLAWDLSWAPLLWVLASELAPAKARAAATGVVVACFWASSAVTNQLLLTMLNGIGASATMTVVACLAAACGAAAWVLVPETAGLPLSAVRALFERRKPGTGGPTDTLGTDQAASRAGDGTPDRDGGSDGGSEAGVRV